MLWNLEVDGPEGPGAVSLADLSRILEHVNKLLEATVGAKVDMSTGKPLISLVSIGSGSLRLALEAPDEAQNSIAETEDLLAGGAWESLPKQAREAATGLSEIMRRHAWELRSAWNGRQKVLIPRDRDLRTLTPGMKTETVLYGQVLRLGGVTPTVTLRCWDGKDYSIAADRDVVLQLRLYSEVGLRVSATYLELGPREWRWTNLRVLEILPYEGGSFAKGIAELAQKAGETWRNVDVEDYIRRIRTGS
jgi:hypothetical protein